MDIHRDEVKTTADHSNQCRLCNKSFSKKTNLDKHLRNVHGISSIATSRNTIHCLEELCLFSCKDITTLREHLIQEHQIDMEVQNVKFQTQKGTSIHVCTLSSTI